MARPIQVLIVEDCPQDAELLVNELRLAQFDPQWRRVETEADYLASLHPDLDLIISDYTMPQFDGMDALDLLKSKGYEIPFIFVSGTIGEERAVEAIKRGATDYVMKDRRERLGSIVGHALEENRLRQGFKKAEQALQDGERKFRALFDAAHDAIYMLHNGVFVDCNTKGQSMYGRTWDQIVGHTPDEFAPPNQPDGSNSREKAFEIVQKALAGEAQSFEWCTIHADGYPVYSEISLNRIEMDGKVYLMAITRDITDRRRAEEQITEQAALLDEARDAIAVRDLNGSILFWNKGAERIYGWTREEVLGRNMGQVLYANPAPFESAHGLILKHGEWSGNILHLTKDGRELMIESRCTLLRDKDGHPKSVLGIYTDVTEKKSFEAQLMRAQRMESIGTLAGGIAHDLNNILTPILTSIEILKLRETDPRNKRILDAIEASSKRGADIVRQVLSFARGIKGERVEIKPKRLLKDIETLIADTFPKNIRVKLSIPRDSWTLLGDPTLMHQILLNLSVNARDAMPEGGTLTITVENTVLDEHQAVTHVGAKPGRYVAISVIDSGTGIPATFVDKIFEPFFTTKEVGKGTGLGLSTVLAIVKSHDGFVEVQSEPGKGTTFKVFLPAMQVSSGKREASAALATLPHGRGETILVVDDEASILDVTSETLETFGYRTLTAHDGAEAIDVYRRRGNEISAVLTDMTMPVMDGSAAIRVMMKINPSVKIIASSGFKLENGLGNASEAGSKYFLIKPYSAETLLKTVRMILDEK